MNRKTIEMAAKTAVLFLRLEIIFAIDKHPFQSMHTPKPPHAWLIGTAYCAPAPNIHSD